MSTVYIGSVSPIPLKVERNIYGGQYFIPAVKRGAAPFVLVVEDKVQYERQPVTHQVVPIRIAGEEIAADILSALNSGAPGMGSDADMGLWLIGTKPDFTPEQVAEATRKLTNFLQYLVLDTDAWSPDRRAKYISQIGIPPIRKVAANYLGYERDWATEAPSQIVLCPYCKKSVKSGAVKCEHCNEVVDHEAYAVLEAKKAAAVAAKMPTNPGPPRPPVKAA